MRNKYKKMKLNLINSINITEYCQGKTNIILEILRQRKDDFTEEEFKEIELANR
jgi:hypothetical protein